MDATKKRTREQMEDTDAASPTSPDSAKRRRISTEDNDESKVNDSPNESSAFATTTSSGFSKFSGGFQAFAGNNETESTSGGFASQSNSFASFSWGKESTETKKFSFGDGSSSFDWANKDFTFGSGKPWGQQNEEDGGNGEDSESFKPTSPTKPRQGEIAGVAVDPGDSQDVTQFSAIVKVYRLESIESDGKSSGPGLEAANTTDTPRKKTTATATSSRTTKYVEKGMGEMRVNTFVDPETKRVRARLLCRREKVMTTLLNVPILPQEDDSAINEFAKANDAYVKFSVIECVEGSESQLSTYLLKPKDKNQLDDILLNIEAAQQRVQEQDEDAEIEGGQDAN